MLQETITTDTPIASPATGKSEPIRLKLTDIAVKNLPVPSVGQKTYLDSIVEPFGVRVSEGRAKTYIVQGRIRGEKHPTRLKIGRMSAITLAAARERAREIVALMEAGKHPREVLEQERREREVQEATARVAAEHSFITVRERYLNDYCPHNLRAKTTYTYASILRIPEFKAWEGRPIASIKREDAEDLIDRVKANHPARVKGKPAYTANNVKRCASAMWNKYVIPKRLSQHNAERRQRALKPAELYVLWRAFSGGATDMNLDPKKLLLPTLLLLPMLAFGQAPGGNFYTGNARYEWSRDAKRGLCFLATSLVCTILDGLLTSSVLLREALAV